MKTFFLVSYLTLALVSSTHADLIAYWNFNDLTTTSGVPSNVNQTNYSPDQGIGSLNLVGWRISASSSPNGISNDTGSTLNAIGSEIAGQSLKLTGGTRSTVLPLNNGATLILSFSMAGMENPILSFATERDFYGFNNNSVDYSLDGVNYTNWAGGTGPSYVPQAGSFGLQTFDFSTQDTLDNTATAFIKITFRGASDRSGFNLIDNIQVNASAVPEPSAFMLAAFGIVAMLTTQRWRVRGSIRFVD
jgi:hypothetical protein